MPTVVTLHDVQHRDLPEFFGPARRSFRRDRLRPRDALGATRSIVTASSCEAGRSSCSSSTPRRVHVIPHAINHTLFRQGDEEREPFLLYPARPWPHKNHARLFEAFAILRKTRPRAAPRPHGRRARAARAAPGRRRALGDRPGRRARVAVPARGVPRLPEPVRGVRAAAARGDGVGCPVAAARTSRDPGGLRRCGRALRPARPGVDREPASSRRTRARDELREQGLARAAAFTWEDDGARARASVYRSRRRISRDPRVRLRRCGRPQPPDAGARGSRAAARRTRASSFARSGASGGSSTASSCRRSPPTSTGCRSRSCTEYRASRSTARPHRRDDPSVARRRTASGSASRASTCSTSR